MDSAPVDCDPAVALAPDQAPEAVQALAPVADQERTDALSLATLLGAARSCTVGGKALTETVADCVAPPPGPVQVRVKLEVDVSSPVDCEPLNALAPFQAPEALQAVALAEDQVRVALPPLDTALGPTLKLTVGAGDFTDTVADCEALPPGPLQLNV